MGTPWHHHGNTMASSFKKFYYIPHAPWQHYGITMATPWRVQRARGLGGAQRPEALGVPKGQGAPEALTWSHPNGNPVLWESQRDLWLGATPMGTSNLEIPNGNTCPRCNPKGPPSGHLLRKQHLTKKWRGWAFSEAYDNENWTEFFKNPFLCEYSFKTEFQWTFVFFQTLWRPIIILFKQIVF